MAKTRVGTAAVRPNADAGERPAVRPGSRKEWRAWLRKHHSTASAVWLVFAKKHTGLPCPSYNDAVEEALCFGWIDGLVNPVDGTYYKQLFTPRKPKSAWARSNKIRVARLIEEGLMTSAGLRAIETAKANGAWTALDHVESLTMPPELRKALNGNAQSRKRWLEFSDSQRKQFLYWLASAKREETREQRIGEIVAMAAQGITRAMAFDQRRRKAKP
jgi:uncharacterized protein YdeI (YjbR/CyaY-like superfamily)